MQQTLAPHHSNRAALPLPRPGVRTALGPWLLLALLLLGLGLRISLLNRPGLHPDEALYASWALRVADGSDPALLSVAIDKPPLQIYALAALFRLAGVDGHSAPIDFARLAMLGRLLGIVASMGSLALLYRIARQVYGSNVALAAVALAAVSPLAVRLSSTLFVDPLLVFWLLLALWAGLRRQGWLMGLGCGLAYATKQQAVLFIPWIAAVMLLAGQAQPVAVPSDGRAMARRPFISFVKGFLLIAVVVLWWDSLRWQWMPSYWDRSLTAYGGLSLATQLTLPTQLVKWGELIGYIFGSPLLTVGLLGALPVVGWAGWQGRRSRAGRFDLLLVVLVAGYLTLHLATTIAPWDRYALPLAPVLALLLVRGFQQAARLLVAKQAAKAPGAAPQVARHVTLTVAVLLLAAGTQAAALSTSDRLPVGDASAYDGAPAVAAYLRQAEPRGAVLYHHWLGWHYGFYLYGTAVELHWWESPSDLAAKAIAPTAAGVSQYIAVPAGRDLDTIQAALDAVGVQLEAVFTASHHDGTPSLTLYRLRIAGGSDHAG